MTTDICSAAPSGPTETTASRHQRVASAALSRQGACGPDASDAGHNFYALLQLAAEQFAVGAVGHAEAEVHRLQLVIHVEPGAAERLDVGQRREPRVDGLRALRGGRARLRRRARLHFLFERAGVVSAILD